MGRIADALKRAEEERRQRLASAGAAIGVIIFLIAFILVIPYTLYAFNKWFE